MAPICVVARRVFHSSLRHVEKTASEREECGQMETRVSENRRKNEENRGAGRVAPRKVVSRCKGRHMHRDDTRRDESRRGPAVP